MRARVHALIAVLLASQIALAAALAGTASGASATTTPWAPANGVLISNPNGTHAQRYVIQDRIVRMINSTPKGEFIRLAAWNIESKRVTDALVQAHKRGVTVRVLMDEANLPQNPNFKHLQYELKYNNNRARAASRRSIAKTCNDTCRGGKGAMHSKVILVSRIGNQRDIVMHGAANMTQAIVARQWTDMVTIAGQAPPYNFWLDRFDEMWLDKPASPQYRKLTYGQTMQFALPFRGGAAVNADYPPLKYLKMVRCTGVAKGFGSNGRTVIRIGIAALRNNLGLSISKRLKALWNQGCNIRVLYAVMGADSYRVLRSGSGRGAVPIRHIVSDPNRDGNFDKYIHTKFLMISGHLGSNSKGNMVLMGSPNWSNLADISDENLAAIFWPGVVKQYWRFADRWFNNPPRYNRIPANMRGMRGLDPYATINAELG